MRIFFIQKVHCADSVNRVNYNVMSDGGGSLLGALQRSSVKSNLICSLNFLWPFFNIFFYFSGENHEVEPSRLGRPYSSKLALYSQHGTTNKYSNQPDLTLDASKEFNVTLMLRAPDGQPPNQQNQKSPPPPYEGKNKQRNHSFTSSSLGSEETNKTLLSSRHDLGIYL